jgi:hypothetical protein
MVWEPRRHPCSLVSLSTHGLVLPANGMPSGPFLLLTPASSAAAGLFYITCCMDTAIRSPCSTVNILPVVIIICSGFTGTGAACRACKAGQVLLPLVLSFTTRIVRVHPTWYVASQNCKFGMFVWLPYC